MIRVNEQPEPAEFDALVRQPGLLFLAKYPSPTSKDYESPNNYWTNVLFKMRTAYGWVCAYCCEYIPYGTQIDHFWPKSKPDYKLAYEWSNYRLACGIVNSRKGVKTILDPFTIQDGWFRMQFTSLQIVPAPESILPPTVTREQIQYAITELKLNDEGEHIPARKKHVIEYCRSGDFQHLTDMAPFIAKELTRQGYVQTIKEMMDLQMP